MLIATADEDSANARRITGREVMSRGDQPDVDAAANELHARIRAAIAALPDRQREVAC